jgi:hypothetical protein
MECPAPLIALSLKGEIIALLSRLYSATPKKVQADVNIAGINDFVARLEEMGY